MTNENARLERRSAVRVSPKGTVTVRADTYVMRGRIVNVSLGGISAHTRITAPERLLGCPAELDLRLDGQDSSWLSLRGCVLRIDARVIALRFDAVPASFARIIDATVSASYYHARVLSIVLVDATAERRSAMSEAFRIAGCTVIDVSTPLEAIVRLGESHFEPDVIAIADSLPETTSQELRRFVDAEHPRAKLVTIGDAADGPAGLAHWLSAANPADDLARRVRTVLTAKDRI
jgi:CheY-like chemotaxis protein